MVLSHPTTGSARTNGRDEYEQFVRTRSRVIRLFNLPSDPTGVLGSAFGPASVHQPVSFWQLRETEERSVWAVFATHDEALAALSLSGANLSIASSCEQVLLDNILRLKKIDVVSPPAMDDFPYTLSTNPPNPRSTASNVFRHGDWLCPHPHCAVHNFSRNLVCISCATPRPNNLNTPVAVSLSPTAPPFSSPLFAHHQHHQQQQSPRFASQQQAPPPPSPLAATLTSNHIAALQLAASTQKGQSLLTPSGRSFSVGGKVQNISSDPLSPCIIFWPDNEPFPDQCQIRPPMVGGVQPPILNTGNKGPIEHQPGDWVCNRCGYHNWRRRKVCQTCFPFAEGNSDNVTTAAQQDRINLLASLLAQQHAAAQAHQLAHQFNHHPQHTSAASALPPPPPPYQFPVALPHSSPPKHGHGNLSSPASGIPTPPNEPLDITAPSPNPYHLPSRTPSRLQRFASQPALRATWNAAGGQVPSPLSIIAQPRAESPLRAPLSAGYAQQSHIIPPLPRLPPVNTSRVATLNNSNAGSTPPLSAKSDSFSFVSASSGSDYDSASLPFGRHNSVFVSNGSSGSLNSSSNNLQSAAVPRMYGSMACLPQRPLRERENRELDLDAFRLGLKLDEGDDDDLDDDEQLSRPGTGSVQLSGSEGSGGSASMSARGSISSSVSIGDEPATAIFTAPRIPISASDANAKRGPFGFSSWSRASIAVPNTMSPWADVDEQVLPPRRGTAHMVAPIGSGRSGGVGGGLSTASSSPAQQQNTPNGNGSNYALVNIGGT